jgi:hypothetical protein
LSDCYQVLSKNSIFIGRFQKKFPFFNIKLILNCVNKHFRVKNFVQEPVSLPSLSKKIGQVVLKKILYILLFLGGISFQSNAQETEVGLWGGVANYFGDLNSTYSFKDLRWAGGVFYRYNLNPRMAVRGGINYARIAADDSKNQKSTYAQVRNLNFQSDILEVAATYEINFFKYQPEKKKNFTPYLFIGASIFYYNPFTVYDGERFDLHELGTEGQNSTVGENNKYSRFAVAIPYGGGIKYAFNRNWALNVEVSSRRTFTDYIDDVSNSYVDPEILGDLTAEIADQSEEGFIPGKQRGTAKDIDRFSFMGVAVTYTLQTLKCPPIYNKEF